MHNKFNNSARPTKYKKQHRSNLLILSSILIACVIMYFISLSTRISNQDEKTEALAHSDRDLEAIVYSELETASDIYDTHVANPYPDLSVPTYITKIDGLYFLVDCYHNQIVYNDNLADPLTDWLVMTNEINRGHTIASDGLVYLADDTENHRILVFEKKDGAFAHTQTFSDIGNRPHYIVYDRPTDTFYAWSSMSGEMYLFRHEPEDTRMYLSEIRRIEQLDNVYVRSFTILDDEIYFVSGNSSILRVDLNSFKILESYPVPESMAGMIQLTKIEDYYYITVSTDITGNQDYATILRTRDLSGLMQGDYEDIYETFIGGGTPYYITTFDNAYYLTEHRLPGHSIWRFYVQDNELLDVETIY